MLEIKADGKDIEATKMLKLATTMIKLLNEVEKGIIKERGGKQPATKWKVNILSGSDYGLIQIFNTGERSIEEDLTAKKAMAALHGLKMERVKE